MSRFSHLLAPISAALVVFVLLFPYAGIDSSPPECYSVFGYVVPCELGTRQRTPNATFASAGALLALLLVALGVAVDRRYRPSVDG